MLNLLRARSKSPYLLVFGIHRNVVHFVVVDVRDTSQPQLIVSDEHVVTQDDAAASMRALLDKYSRYGKHNPRLALVLGSGLYQSVTLDKPQLSDAELASSLRYQLTDLVSFEPDDCLADYYELPLQVQGQQKIHAIAASRSQLAPLLKVAHELTERVQGIYAEEQALEKLHSENTEAGALVYQQNQQPALVQVYSNAELQVTRAVRSLEKISELTLDEIKLGGLQPLSIEIQRSADYFERQLRQRPLAVVWLAIGIEKNQEVLSTVHEDLGLDVVWASYPSWAQELAAGDYSDFPVLGGALLALADSSNEPEVSS